MIFYFYWNIVIIPFFNFLSKVLYNSLNIFTIIPILKYLSSQLRSRLSHWQFQFLLFFPHMGKTHVWVTFPVFFFFACLIVTALYNDPPLLRVYCCCLLLCLVIWVDYFIVYFPYSVQFLLNVIPQKAQLWACMQSPWDDSGFSRYLFSLSLMSLLSYLTLLVTHRAIRNH